MVHSWIRTRELRYFCSVLFCSLKCGQGFLLLNKLLKNARKPCFRKVCFVCIGLPEPIDRNPFNYVRISSVTEPNRTQFVRLSSICSEIELTESPVFDFVRLPNSIELNPWIEFDWVRLSSIEFDFRTFDLLCREGGVASISSVKATRSNHTITVLTFA